MFKKILVALDRSSEADSVLNFALSLAQPGTSEILLVHFIEWQMQDVSPWIGVGTLYDIDLSGDRYHWNRQHLEAEIEIVKDWLKAMAEKANQFEVSYECHIGNCNLGIGDRAKDWGADVIVIGRRGHRNISEILLGSVSNYVIHHAPCSVLVVQGSSVSLDDRLATATEADNY